MTWEKRVSANERNWRWKQEDFISKTRYPQCHAYYQLLPPSSFSFQINDSNYTMEFFLSEFKETWSIKKNCFYSFYSSPFVFIMSIFVCAIRNILREKRKTKMEIRKNIDIFSIKQNLKSNFSSELEIPNLNYRHYHHHHHHHHQPASPSQSNSLYYNNCCSSLLHSSPPFAAILNEEDISEITRHFICATGSSSGTGGIVAKGECI